MKNRLSSEIILDVSITNARQKDVLEYIFTSLLDAVDPYYIVTPNPEIIVAANRNKALRTILNQAQISLPDGVGVTTAARFLGKPLKERITGTDILEEICKASVNSGKKDVKKPITVGFLGARENVAELTAECLREKYPGLEVVFAAPEWSEEGFTNACRLMQNPRLRYKTENYLKYQVSSIKYQVGNEKALNTKYSIHNTDVIDILFVAFGFPRQEEWMAEHVGKIPVKIMIGVGGAFDYISGRVSRAPAPVRAMGMEWLYRLSRQPWRLRRQLALFEFVSLVIKEKL